MTQELATLSVFAVTSGVLYLALQRFDRYNRTVRKRLRQVGGDEAADKRRDAASSSGTEPALRRILPEVEDREKLSQRLRRAGYYHEAAPRLYVLAQLAAVASVLVASAAAIAAGLLPGSSSVLLSTTVLAAASCLAPSIWLRHATEQRKKLYRKSVPDLLDLMVICLDGGMSLPFTLKRAASEMQLVHPALASELLLVQRDVEMGATLEKSLGNFADRTDDDEIRTLSMLVGEAQRYGSSISEALREHADFVRVQRETAAEEMAQKATVKLLLPLLLLILPAVFVVVAGPAFLQLSQAFAER